MAHRADNFLTIGIAVGFRGRSNFTPGNAQRTLTEIRGDIGKFEVPSGVL